MSANVAWGCGPIPLESSDQYQAIMKFRLEWEIKEPFLPLSGPYFRELLMYRLYFKAVGSGIIPVHVSNTKEDISCSGYQLEMFSFR